MSYLKKEGRQNIGTNSASDINLRPALISSLNLKANKEFNSPFYYRNFSHLYGEVTDMKKLKKNVPVPANQMGSRSNREIRKAIKIGLKMSTDPKNYTKLRQIFSEEDKYLS